MKLLRELQVHVPLSHAAQRLPKEQQRFIQQCSSLKAATMVLQRIQQGADPNAVKMPTSSLIMDVELRITRDGEGFLQTDSQRECIRPWLVTSCMTNSNALRMCLVEENLLPIGGCAVPLAYHSHEDAYSVIPIVDLQDNDVHHGLIFTYLPLPIHSGLPVHINGAFAVTSNRRQLCEPNEDDKFDARAQWNAALMGGPVSTAYAVLLEDLARISAPKHYPYAHLWPRSCAQPVCAPLTISLYQALARCGPPRAPAMYSDGQRWVSLDHAVFLAEDFRSSEVGNIAMEVFQDCLVGRHELVIELPDWARRGFVLSNRDDVIRSKSYNITRFLKDIMLPEVLSVSPDHRDKIIIYALKRNEPEIDDLLRDHLCIPVTPDGTMVKAPSQLIDPTSEVAALYAPEEGYFPYNEETFSSEELLCCLRRIGIMKDHLDLTWEDIVDRVESVKVSCVSDVTSGGCY